MNIKHYCCLFLLLLCQVVFCQSEQRKEIQGIIKVDSVAVEGVNITNETTHNVISSDENGNFSIQVKTEDVLVFSAVNVSTFKKIITVADFKDTIVVVLHTKSFPLKEVIINEDSKITAENLGIVPSGQKKYTVAERRYAASRSGLLDRPLNWISGRSKMLKKELEVENKERLLTQLKYLFEENFYVSILKIRTNYIVDFQLYCLEDTTFVNSLKTRNKSLSKFYILSLAENYNKIIKYEN